MLSFVERIIAELLRMFPYKYITLESNPDFSDNTKAIFDEIVTRGLNKKYRIVWLCRKPHSSINDNVICVQLESRWKKTYYLMRSKCIISCNSYIPKYTKSQYAIYLGHGIALKSMKTYPAPKLIDSFVGLSDTANKIMKDAFKCSLDKFIITGYPRNDSLFINKRKEIDSLFAENYDKLIVWYPTFRQHNNPNVNEATIHALPIIYDAQIAQEINDFAKEHRILIVLKPHFSQDLSYIKNVKLSNIIFINDDFFTNNNLTSYEFVGNCDALITDYSSIYFDYLLCNKPIGAIWEDIEEYRSNRGFCIDIDFYMKGAFKIYNVNDFKQFLLEVSTKKDSLSNKRKEINDIINKYQDSHSTDRVLRVIESYIS